MVGRRRRLGKYVAVCFADPPWTKNDDDWIRLEQDLPPDHAARRIVNAMMCLDLKPLRDSYSAGGSPPIRPDLMLRIVLIEMQRGRFRPSQWWRDAKEHTPLMWAGFGIRPSRTAWYAFAERIAPFLDSWNRQVIDAAKAAGVTTATRGSIDGSTVAANASRHRLLNREQLAKRLAAVESALANDAGGETLPGWMAKTPHGRLAQLERLRQAERRLAELHAINARQPSTRRRAEEKIVISPGDPQAAPGRDKLKVFRPLYNVQLVRDLDSNLVLGYDVFAQTGDEGTLRAMLRRLHDTFSVRLRELLADAGYITACNLALSARRDIALLGPWKENDYTHRTGKTKKPQPFPKDRFDWLPEENAYRCPQGHRLTPIGKERRKQIDGEINTVYRYRCRPDHCRACAVRDACTTNPDRGRSLRRSEHEDLVDSHKARMQTEDAKACYKLRRQTVELGFADLKEHRNLQRFSGRGLAAAKRQTAATILACNLTVLSRAPPPESTPNAPG